MATLLLATLKSRFSTVPASANAAGTARSSSTSRAGRARRGALRVVRVAGGSGLRSQERIVMRSSDTTVDQAGNRPPARTDRRATRVTNRAPPARPQRARGDFEEAERTE